jgi:GNAT superfamily N-acetyltransferase
MPTAQHDPSSPLPSVRIRPATPADRDAALGLAPRLMIGVAPWLDRDGVLAAVKDWVASSIGAPGPDRVALIAEDADGACVGFVSVARREHWSGAVEAYIGELIVTERAEGTGVGRALLQAAEDWARERGYRLIALDTGAANARARRFYDRAGFAEDSVRLVKVVT